MYAKIHMMVDIENLAAQQSYAVCRQASIHELKLKQSPELQHPRQHHVAIV